MGCYRLLFKKGFSKTKSILFNSILVEGISLHENRYGGNKQSRVKSNRDLKVYQNLAPEKIEEDGFLQWDASRNRNRLHMRQKHNFQKNNINSKIGYRSRIVKSNQFFKSHKVDKKLNTRPNKIGN